MLGTRFLRDDGRSKLPIYAADSAAKKQQDDLHATFASQFYGKRRAAIE
jgi:hypothetical protein